MLSEFVMDQNLKDRERNIPTSIQRNNSYLEKKIGEIKIIKNIRCYRSLILGKKSNFYIQN